jgi:hypothetical protein
VTPEEISDQLCGNEWCSSDTAKGGCGRCNAITAALRAERDSERERWVDACKSVRGTEPDPMLCDDAALVWQAFDELADRLGVEL